MPAVNPNSNQTGSGGGAAQRTTFRPPWVKEGPNPLPMPTAPWTPRRRESNPSAEEAPPKAEKPPLRKQSKITIIPSQPSAHENGQVEPPGQSKVTSKEKVIPIKTESRKTTESKDKVIPITLESSPKSSLKQETKSESTPRREKTVKIQAEPEKIVPIVRERQQEKAPPPPPTMRELEKPSTNKTPGPPAPPMPPPPPGKALKPPAPPSKPMTLEKAAKLEALRSRPRRRPDWTDMMKEVEQGAKLKHVQCNDRSAPVLPVSKAKGQFVYESEKDNAHNQLLKQIQKGVSLKKVKCNDRSKPNLDGLRKFRRQMTIEEQIQKSASVADVVAVAAEPDELDDIDKVRDDLQSTKQMLALEMRNKEALERENKRLMARLLNLEVELEKEKLCRRTELEKGAAIQIRTEEDEKLITKLKEEAVEATAVAKEMEDKYHKTAEQLDATRAKLETAWLLNQQLEIDLKAAQSGVPHVPLAKAASCKKLAASMASIHNGRTPDLSDDSEYEEETETESEEDGKDADAAQEKRIARELKLLSNKLKAYKEKKANALKERHSLREHLSKQQKILREEKKKYRTLQKEVDKMAKLMKDVDDEEAEDDKEDEDEDEEEETETETESEESEDEEDEESEGDLSDSANPDDKRNNFNERTRHYENRLAALKKGNFLLKANIDRIQDDVNRQREMSLSLQEDLNSVLAELG